MRIKLDENMPSGLVGELTSLGHDVDTVPAEGIAGRGDDEVWTAAQTSNRFFITQDLEFSDVRRFEPGTHAGILLVRLREPSRRMLMGRIRTLFAVESVEQWSRSFVVATDRKVRVRKPPNR